MTGIRPSSYAVDIPAEPTALRILTDREGDVWQLDQQQVREGRLDHWRCTRTKVQGLIGGTNVATWRWLLFNLSPITPVQWVENEAG